VWDLYFGAPMRYLYPTEGSKQGSFAPGIEVGDFVFVAGTVGMTPEGELPGEDAASQTRQALANVEAVLKEAGATLSDIVQTTVYLTDFSQFTEYDTAWREVFGDHLPPRATVDAKLAWDKLLVEVQAIAYVGERDGR
jgi:2-iminobutanoate/2-iminopropanoate deaminase